MLIGGLGIGHALDEALELPELRSVTVVELEQVVVDWFRAHGGERSARALGDARVEVVVGDVADTLSAAVARWDLVALDTDNGPGWLVRKENGRLYDVDGLNDAASALRVGGVAAFWSAERDPAFAHRLRPSFAEVYVTSAMDVIGRRRNESFVYVGVRHAGVRRRSA